MTSETKIPRPPSRLGKAGRRLWRAVHQQYDMEQHEVELLSEACRTLDVIGDLDQVLAEAGPTTVGSTGQPVVHPALQEARLQRALLAKLLGQLGLPDVDGSSTALTGHQSRSRVGHKARWAPVRTPDGPGRGA